MKRLYLQIVVLTLLFFLFACTTTQTKHETSQVRPLGSGERIALIGDVNGKSEFSDTEAYDCLSDEILGIMPKLTIVKPDDFRNQLFPYFSGSTAPHSADEYKALLNNPLVSQRIRAMGIRYLITLVESKTDSDYNNGIFCGGGYGGGGCIGLGLWDRNTRLKAQIWNLKNGNLDGNVQTQAEGTGVMPALLLPIPVYFPATEAATCKELSEIIGKILSGSP